MTSETDPQARNINQGPLPDASLDSVLLTIGRIVAAHGLRGEVKLVLTTDRPEKMKDLRRVYLNNSDTATRITSFRLRGNDREALLKLPGVNDRDEAERLRGTIVKIRGNQLPPPEDGAFFHFQILGLRAVDEEGQELGTVTEIIDAGEVDVYVITDPENRQILLPALQHVVLDIRPQEDHMVVRPLEYKDEGK